MAREARSRLLAALSPLSALCGLAVALLSAPAEAEPLRCLFDDPARAVAARESGETPACRQIDREARRPAVLTLPMPCGHVMHFARVDVGVGHVLGQVRPTYGDARATGSGTAPDRASAVGPWSEALSAPFERPSDSAPQERDRAYYMGVYEVTRPQWHLFEAGLFAEGAAVLEPGAPLCGEHDGWMAAADARSGYGRPDLVLPETGMSWYDAVDFARAYTGWLTAVDARLIAAGLDPLLPWADGSPGFLRLPTEAEWEFAARDGQVGPEAANRRLHLVRRAGEAADPALAEIAQLEPFPPHGVHGAGRKAPNLLGLHDMLGNAEEYVQDLFRATRPDGLHGQRGGAVLRGGSPATPDANISLGYRREVPLFSLTGEMRPPTAGLRLVISAPFFARGAPPDDPFPTADYANTALARALAESRARLVRRDVKVADMAALLAAMERARAPEPDEVRALLAQGRALLEKAAAESATAAREALRQRLITGATLSTAIARTGANVNDALLRPAQLREKILSNARYSESERRALLARVDDVVARLDGREREIEAIYQAYLDNLSGLAAEPDAALLARIERSVTGRFAAPGLETLAAAYERQSRHLAELRAEGAWDDSMAGRWLYEIDVTRRERDEKRAGQ